MGEIKGRELERKKYQASTLACITFVNKDLENCNTNCTFSHGYTANRILILETLKISLTMFVSSKCR